MVFRLYFDDDIEIVVVCEELKQRGFDVIRASEAGMRGKPDFEHLAFAVQQERAIVTGNRGDFLRLHAEYLTQGRSHCGMVIVIQQQLSFGELLKRFHRLLSTRSAEQMRDWVEFLSDWGDDRLD